MIRPGTMNQNNGQPQIESQVPNESVIRHGFTLIELMVVLAIIAVLVATTVMVGSAVVNTGKKHATEGIIQSLDVALAAYIDKKGDIPPALVEIPYAMLPSSLPGLVNDETSFYPAIDGQGQEAVVANLSLVNSVGLFVQSASVVPEVQTLIDGIDGKYVSLYSPDEEVQPSLRTVFDAWGNPIRYVHPKFDGIIERERRSLGDAGEPLNIVNPNKPYFLPAALPTSATTRVRMKFVRRNRLVDADFGDEGLGGGGGGLNQQQLSDFDLIPDSDGGLTTGNRPYFYSAGPDGNPATIEDNIYSSIPQFVDPGVN